jgi:hypothetical protein
MLQPGQKLLFLEENERKAILSYCARTTVGFLSVSNDSFYGSGVLATANDTWIILTAAHVVTAVERYGDCKVILSNDYFEGKEYPVAVRNYSSLASRVSNSRRDRNWNPTEIDIGIIVPPPSLLEGLANLRPIDLRLGDPATNFFTSEKAVILGFPERFQRTARKDFKLISNPVCVQFVQVPSDGRQDDLALGWDKIYQVTANRLENSPSAAGMSGGPVFSYIREVVPGPWTAEKQLIFSGILHYQHDDKCLLGHNRQVVKDFVSGLLGDPEDSGLKDALANGYKSTVCGGSCEAKKEKAE